MRPGCTVLCALALFGLLVTRVGAQGVSIHMHSGEGYAADGVLFEPTAGQAPFAAILVIPDGRGVIKRVVDAAEDLAAAGYFVVVVDLNRGEPADVAKHSDERTLHDLNAAFAFLSKQSRVRHDCVGALGWESGGIYALRLAAGSKVCAVAIREVILPKDPAVLGTIHAAVLGSFGGDNSPVSSGPVKVFETRLKALGTICDFKVYPQAARGFDDPEDSAHFRPSDAEDVRQRTQSFFKAQLSRRP